MRPTWWSPWQATTPCISFCGCARRDWSFRVPGQARNLDTRLALDRTLGRLSTDRRTEAQAGGIPLLYSLTKNTATRQLKARCDLQEGYACSQYSREAQLWFKLQENWSRTHVKIQL